MHYADTGFLVSLYLPEATTAPASAAMRRVTQPIAITELNVLELRNAFRLAVFRRFIAEDDRARCWALFEDDVAGSVYERATVPSSALYEHASRLVEVYGSRLGTRTLDVLHVAAASLLGASTFLSFDRRQRALARAAKLRVAP